MSTLRLSRLIHLLTLLRVRDGHTARSLAVELDVSERTVYRDLNALQLAGMPFSFDSESGGYRMDGDFFLPPLQLTFTEAMALSALTSDAPEMKQVPLMQAARRAIAKIKSQLPLSVRRAVAAVDGHVEVRGPRVSPQPGCESHLELLRQAITGRRKVRCSYDHGRGEGLQPFLFRPYTFFFDQRAWYVVGYSEHRNDVRFLKLNRIRRLELTERPFMIPDGWSIEDKLGYAWRMIRGDHRYRIAIRFDGEVSRTVTETMWHRTQSIEWKSDGGCVLRWEVDGLEEILWWILSYGPHARVLSPPLLQQRVASLSSQTARQYRRSGVPAKRRLPQAVLTEPDQAAAMPSAESV